VAQDSGVKVRYRRFQPSAKRKSRPAAQARRQQIRRTRDEAVEVRERGVEVARVD